MANDRLYLERMGCQGPHPDIQCRTCALAHGEPPFADGPEKANCKHYTDESGQTKPSSVYYDGNDCEFYQPEKNTAKGGE